MAENMMCENQKATNDKYRSEYERIFKPKHPKELWPGSYGKGIDYMMSKLFQELQEDIVMELLFDGKKNETN